MNLPRSAICSPVLPHSRRVALAISAALAFAGAAAAQSIYDCDVLVTEEARPNVHAFRGASGDAHGVFATIAGNPALMGVHTGAPGNHVLVGTMREGVREVHRDSGTLIRVYNPGGGWQWAGVYHPSGDVLIGDMSTNDVRRYDPSDGSLIGVFAAAVLPADMRYGPNGNLFICSFSNGVYEVNGLTGAPIALRAPSVGQVNDIVFMPDGRRIITSMATNMAHVFDAAWSPVATFAGTGWGRPHGIDRSPYDGDIYVIDGVTQSVHVFDATSYLELDPAFLSVATKPVDLEFRRSPIPCGSVTNFGVGCGPAIRHAGQARIGSTLHFDLESTQASQPAFLLLGHSDVDWLGLPLPFDLALLGAPNCLLLVEALVTVPTFTGAGGAAQVPLSVPLVPEAIGVYLYGQWAVFSPGVNELGLQTSDGLRARIGG